jgi:hypothetical protein
MKYFGRVLDLDGFDGSVTIKNSVFTSNILRYANCDVAQDMETDPAYVAATDKYAGYGPKTVY